MRITNIFFLCLVAGLSAFQKGNAQPLSGDSLLRKGSSAYLQLMKQQSPLYTGAEYIAPKQLIEGFPFFGQEQYYEGMLVSSGVSFFNIPIQYDLVQDALLIWSFDRSILLMMNAEKIDRFKLGKEVFVRGSLVKQNETNVPKGFFQLIYEGKHLVVSKKQKVIVQKSASDKSYAFYKQFNTYYIVIDGNWKQVGSQKNVLNLLKKKKEEIKRHINERGLSFRKNPEGFLSEVMSYYDTLD